jgi:hypothetical protein
MIRATAKKNGKSEVLFTKFTYRTQETGKGLPLFFQILGNNLN